MLSCNCLNVIIESETNEFRQITADLLNLSEEEKQDPFFKQDIKQVVKLNKINKEHSGLVISNNVGSWIFHKCLNCDTLTHAIHRDRGASYVLVSSKLLTSPSIQSLQNSEQFSPTFNVVVPERDDGDEKQSENLPPDVQLALGGLKQRANEVFNREAAAVEERVRHFTELQYADLETFREKAHKEHKSLARIILEKRYQPLSSSNNYSAASPKYHRLSSENVASLTATLNSPKDNPKIKLVTKIKNNNSRSAIRQKTTPLTSQRTVDPDDLLLFGEFDAAPQSSASEREDSDHEESLKSDSLHVNRSRSQSMSIAKSLPVNIPAFMFQHRGRDTDDEHDDFIDEHPSDIAASIKALAKSVHGDTVFGDLPRPRFSTQI